MNQGTAPTSRERRTRLLGDLLLFLLVLVPCLAGSNRFALVDVDEPRFASASRAMARMDPGEDWIVPHFNGNERFDKPILIYWLQALAMLLLGPFERAARLPSALAIAACAPMVASIARLLGARLRAAWIAGFVTSTCALAIVMAHASTADALLLACTTACARLQIGRFVHGESKASLIALWLAVAAAFLAKGPAAWVGPAALAVALLIAGARPRPVAVGIGMLIALVPILAWGIPALVISEGRFWTVGVLHHVVERSSRPFEGHGGDGLLWWLFYLGSIPVTLLPWTPLLGLAVPVLRGKVAGLRPGADRILLWWVLLTVAAFTASASKMPHYVLPCFPALAVVIALGVQHRAERVPAPTAAWLGWAFLAIGVTVLIGLPALLFRTGLADPAVAAAVMAAAFVIGAGFTLAALRRGRWYLAVGCMAAATLLGFTTLGARVMPSLDGELVTTGLRQELLKELKPGMQVALYREVMPSLTFYLDRVVPSIEAAGKDSSALRALELASKPGTLVLLRKTHLDDLKAALPELAQRHPELAREAERVLANPRIVMKGMNLNRASNTEFVVLGRSTSS